MWRGPAWLTVLRDMACLALGCWGVVHEELGGKPDPVILGIYGVFMVAPGLLAAHWLGQAGQPATGGPSSESPPSSPSSPSPSPGSPG